MLEEKVETWPPGTTEKLHAKWQRTWIQIDDILETRLEIFKRSPDYKVTSSSSSTAVDMIMHPMGNNPIHPIPQALFRQLIDPDSFPTEAGLKEGFHISDRVWQDILLATITTEVLGNLITKEQNYLHVLAWAQHLYYERTKQAAEKLEVVQTAFFGKQGYDSQEWANAVRKAKQDVLLNPLGLVQWVAGKIQQLLQANAADKIKEKLAHQRQRHRLEVMEAEQRARSMKATVLRDAADTNEAQKRANLMVQTKLTKELDLQRKLLQVDPEVLKEFEDLKVMGLVSGTDLHTFAEWRKTESGIQAAQVLKEGMGSDSMHECPAPKTQKRTSS